MDNILFEDVKDEIFDMVKPKDPYKITLQDLIRRSVYSHMQSCVIVITSLMQTWDNSDKF